LRNQQQDDHLSEILIGKIVEHSREAQKAILENFLYSVPGALFDVPVRFLSLHDLIATKEASGRKSDLHHLKLLKRS
jgi:hypothetical protein